MLQLERWEPRPLNVPTAKAIRVQRLAQVSVARGEGKRGAKMWQSNQAEDRGYARYGGGGGESNGLPLRPTTRQWCRAP